MKGKYISRMDYGSINGWYVRIPITITNGSTATKFFNDRKHGGKRKAKKVAIEYRDAFLKKHGMMELLNRQYVPPAFRTIQSNNTSGVMGVSMYWSCKHRNGEDIWYGYWKAQGMVDGEQWRKTFSCFEYGDKEAFIMACEERYKRMGPLTILDKKKLTYNIPKKYVRQNNPTKRRTEK